MVGVGDGGDSTSGERSASDPTATVVAMQRRDSTEWGWLVVRRSEYDRMRTRDYAGPGTPLRPDAPGHWVLANENGATVLYTGVEVIDG